MNTKGWFIALGAFFFMSIRPLQVHAEILPSKMLDWFSVPANFDAHFSQTQFDTNQDHNAVVGQWDIRVEVEPPSWTNTLIVGPYLKLAGIAASKIPAWENGLLAAPGLGAQVYPFSWYELQKRDLTAWLADQLGPLRLYGEYNFEDYWGAENTWRPRAQIRAGADYWLALHSNETSNWWWGEIWAGAWWQSANEFDAHYDGFITAQSLRAGGRIPNAHLISWITPYVLVESSLTDHQSYYWENRLDLGAGVRIAPPLSDNNWFGRVCTHFAIYAEYVHEAAYYGVSAPASIPDHDWRAGITFSLNNWYHDSPSYHAEKK